MEKHGSCLGGEKINDKDSEAAAGVVRMRRALCLVSAGRLSLHIPYCFNRAVIQHV